MNPVTPNTSSASTGTPSDAKKVLLKDIGAKWGKFSEQELGALKNKDDLITQVVAKYSIDKTQAQRDVDAVMKPDLQLPPCGVPAARSCLSQRRGRAAATFRKR